MKGQEVVVRSLYGTKIEGIISGTPKPGTMMQVKASVEPVGGRHTYEVYAPGTGDGAPRPLLILDINHLEGKTFDDAYVSGRRGYLWSPLPGDTVNVRKADISGTGTASEDVAIGDRMLVVDGTGMISHIAVGVANGSAVYPFTALETIVDQPTEMLVHCLVSNF